MMAPRAMTAAVMGLPNRSQGEAAFLQRQCARVRSGNACGRATAGLALSGVHLCPEDRRAVGCHVGSGSASSRLLWWWRERGERPSHD